MSNQLDLFSELSKPFPSNDIEWRVQRSGVKNGRVWAMVIPYVTNRAIQSRLDSVFGVMGWKNEYKEISGGFMCGISIRCPDSKEWVTKWDGAEHTKIESIKGGISGAMKRCAVQWGIGRYLYNLEACFADCFTGREGKNRAEAKGQNGHKTYFTWNPPKLPDFALPDNEKGQKPEPRNIPANHQAPVNQHQDNSEPPAPTKSKPVNSRQQYFKSVADDVKAAHMAKQPERAKAQPSGQVLSPNQFSNLKNALQVTGQSEQWLCHRMQVDSIGKIDSSYYPGIMNHLKKFQPNPVSHTVPVSNNRSSSQYSKRSEMYADMSRYGAGTRAA